jgi:hypothetical protein
MRRKGVWSFRCVRSQEDGRSVRLIVQPPALKCRGEWLSAINTLRLLSRRLRSKSQRVSGNATSGRAIEKLAFHWQDIPAAMSPQKPHSVTGSAGRLSRRGPRACSSSRKAIRIAAAKSTADSRIENLIRMVPPQRPHTCVWNSTFFSPQLTGAGSVACWR